MSDQIVAALIGGGAAILAAGVGWLATHEKRDRASSKYRRALGAPSPIGRWKCDWLKEDGSTYVSDVVDIKSWIRDGRFRGQGTQPDLSYTLEGEVDSTRAVALTYRTVDFPAKAYVGVACLVFNTDGDGLDGYWYGRAKSGEFTGGATKWRRTSAG